MFYQDEEKLTPFVSQEPAEGEESAGTEEKETEEM